MVNSQKRLKFYMLGKWRKFSFLKIKFSNLAEKNDLFYTEMFKYEQDPLNSKDFKAQPFFLST